MVFLISEVENINSVRQGYSYACSSLAYAKRVASLRKVFQGTTLVIRHPDGSVASIKADGKWVDSQDED